MHLHELTIGLSAGQWCERIGRGATIIRSVGKQTAKLWTRSRSW